MASEIKNPHDLIFKQCLSDQHMSFNQHELHRGSRWQVALHFANCMHNSSVTWEGDELGCAI